MKPASETQALARHNDPIAQRDIEVERTIETLEREFGPLGMHERIVVARELDALVHRVGHTFGDNDW
jgi:hypothetical protein